MGSLNCRDQDIADKLNKDLTENALRDTIYSADKRRVKSPRGQTREWNDNFSDPLSAVEVNTPTAAVQGIRQVCVETNETITTIALHRP